MALFPIFNVVAYADNTDRKQPSQPKNVIFILSDDHRYDYMGFLNTIPWLQTPAMDKMAIDGALLQNAFVTTSLSSPSRASILTGMYTHEHEVVDNQAPLPDGLTFFPQYLQSAGYVTGFFGKWHMGNNKGEPQPGFDWWECFAGQGTYYNVSMNVNGEWVSYAPNQYVADLITDHAIDFIGRNKDKPFFVYLSHKSVHDPFQASPSDIGKYDNENVPIPISYCTPYYSIPSLPSKSEEGKPKSGREWYGDSMMPDWVKSQRESWHGVDYLYHGRSSLFEEVRKYCATLTSLDRTIGDLLKYLEDSGLSENTIVIYMGDNGFQWGEHGLIDKRNFYEESVRVPLLAYCPGLISPGQTIKELVQNIDIAPTIMDICGLEKAPQMRGASFYPMLLGEKPEKWRDRIFYEYFWEYDYPQTPTMFGVRTERYKYIRYHGIWDTNEFYDLKEDPHEMNNLINVPEYQDTIKSLTVELYDWLEETDGMAIPLKRTIHKRAGDHRNPKVL